MMNITMASPNLSILSSISSPSPKPHSRRPSTLPSPVLPPGKLPPIIQSLSALLASEVPPDVEAPLPADSQIPDLEPDAALAAQEISDDSLSEDERRQLAEDQIKYELYLQELQNQPKTPPEILQANNPQEILKSVVDYSETVKIAIENNANLLTPSGPRGYFNRARSPRVPGGHNTNEYTNRYLNSHSPESFGQSKIFDTYDERREAIRHQRQLGRRAPLATMLHWGIAYAPSDPSQDQGFRTILIPVPQDYSLKRLITEKLVGRGQIYSAQICQTASIKSAEGFNTAKVVFVTQPAWIDDASVLGQLAVVKGKPATKVATKTWPMSEPTMKAIGRGSTRSLLIMDLPGHANMRAEEIYADLFADESEIPGKKASCLYPLHHSIVKIRGDGRDQVGIEMNSIPAAAGMLDYLSELFADHTTMIRYKYNKEVTMTPAEHEQHKAMGWGPEPLQAHLRALQYSGDSEVRPTTPVEQSFPKLPQDLQRALAASSSRTQASPRPRAYIPPQALGQMSAVPEFAPGKKIFGFAPFPTTQGFYPDGMPNDHKQAQFQKRTASRDDNLTEEQKVAARFVYKGGKDAVPVSTPAAVVPSMGYYRSATGVDWADEDEDEGAGLNNLMGGLSLNSAGRNANTEANADKGKGKQVALGTPSRARTTHVGQTAADALAYHGNGTSESPAVDPSMRPAVTPGPPAPPPVESPSAQSPGSDASLPFEGDGTPTPAPRSRPSMSIAPPQFGALGPQSLGNPHGSARPSGPLPPFTMWGPSAGASSSVAPTAQSSSMAAQTSGMMNPQGQFNPFGAPASRTPGPSTSAAAASRPPFTMWTASVAPSAAARPAPQSSFASTSRPIADPFAPQASSRAGPSTSAAATLPAFNAPPVPPAAPAAPAAPSAAAAPLSYLQLSLTPGFPLYEEIRSLEIIEQYMRVDANGFGHMPENIHARQIVLQGWADMSEAEREAWAALEQERSNADIEAMAQAEAQARRERQAEGGDGVQNEQ